MTTRRSDKINLWFAVGVAVWLSLAVQIQPLSAVVPRQLVNLSMELLPLSHLVGRPECLTHRPEDINQTHVCQLMHCIICYLVTSTCSYINIL